MGAEARAQELGIEFPTPPQPVASYIPAVQTGSLLFISGVIPFWNGTLTQRGKLGKELTVDQGYEARRRVWRF